ncbi:DUF726-domain-containing protein [Cucurbitaria berberidis CBS 394.84]|uniref:DUF726-domain-containing protein n=1 Tax=Cucurbitaria berberidis CBS 394.84 TaxID=1168544 RepID=A0A9P4GMD5_9PLEO|nr:DUF726-domain-containing protein [Cucurbitaria berberidis CBS 394.84]KAF1847690.1 DUF726-domain-containing protein [Cucurbitaria berberidis CBS 394.84]
MLFKIANVVTGTGPESVTKDEGTSLTSVLETPTLRVELALLVLLCTDSMRDELLATFDPSKTHGTRTTTAEAAPAATKARAHTQDLISFDEQGEETAVAARQQEVESTQMQALRRSALTFFDKWRAGVMHRICDVLCVRGDVVRQEKAKRKQSLIAVEKQKQSISSLIDFGDDDPFTSDAQTKSGRRKHGHYDAIQTKLSAFEHEKRVLILHCLLLLLLSLEHYPAHSRVLLLHLASSLDVETDVLAEQEKSVAQGLLATAASQMDAEETTKKQTSNDAATRRWKVGLAAVGGAVLIGMTGGLAAPLLAAGLGTVMGGLGLGVVSTYLGALAGSSVLVGSLFGAYGAKMTGRLMDQYAKEVQDFEFVPIQDPDRPSNQRDQDWSDEQDARDPRKREQHRLRVCIGISGWLSSPSDVNKPWEVIDSATTEPFALRFELDAMLRLGNSLNDVLFSYAWDGVTYTVVSRTLLGALYAGLWPLGLVKVASVLDNPFSVALARADKAGKVLAHALIDGIQGKRPVTLVGYSIGARVIYACLVELANQHAFGLVESVILMGTPASVGSKRWRQIRSVVAARVVNVYSTEDYVLGFLYRSAKLQVGVAGLQEVKDVYGIENFDMSKLVSGHDRYRYLVGTILAKVGFDDLNFNKVAEQERALEVAERKKQQMKERAKTREVQHEQPNMSTQSSKETPAKIYQGRPQPLINVSDNQSPPMPNLNQRSSSQRPTIIKQARSTQQPAIQRTIAMETYARTALQPSLNNYAVSGSDPLRVAVANDTSSPPVNEFVAASNPRQIPSKMVSIPTTIPQLTEAVISSEEQEESKYKNTMTSLDSVEKTGPSMVVTEKVTLKGDGRGTSENPESSGEEDDNVDDEVSSEFGELSLVEPVPMDDFDYGLM